MSIRLAPIAIGAQRLHLAETSGQVLGKNLSATIGQIATNLEPSDDGWELTIPGQVWRGEDASIDVALTDIDAAASASAPLLIPTRPRIDASFASVDSGLALEGSFPDPVAVTVDGVLVESTRAGDRQRQRALIASRVAHGEGEGRGRPRRRGDNRHLLSDHLRRATRSHPRSRTRCRVRSCRGRRRCRSRSRSGSTSHER